MPAPPPAPGPPFARVWVSADDPDLAFVHARYRGHRFAPHTHDGLTLGVVTGGALAFDHGPARRRHVVAGGGVSVVNPGEVHTGEGGSGDGWAYRNLYVGPDALRAVAREAGLAGDGSAGDGLPAFAAPAIDDPALARALLAAHRAAEASPVRLERDGLLLDALVGLVRRHASGPVRAPAPGREPAAVRAARDLVGDRYADDLPLAALAAAAGLSPYHFARVFRAAVGLPPHAYLLGVRVERARQALASGVPVARAALDAGFADQAHLTRRFKATLGVTPGAYRRAVRGT